MVAPEDITRHHDWAARKNDDIWVGRRPAPEPDLTVVDSADEATYVPALEAAGFLPAIREPHWHQHRAFKGDDPLVNLHVFSPDCPEAIRHLMFRDWLRAHPDDVTLYAEAKVVAAAESAVAGDLVMDYNQRKEAAVLEIYARMFAAHGLL